MEATDNSTIRSNPDIPFEERPEEVSSIYPETEFSGFGARSELMKDANWGGLPPVGEKSILSPNQFIIEIILLMLLEMGIWALYRYFSAPILGDAFSYTFFFFHIVMAPLIHLLPIFLYWRFRLSERSLPFLFTRKNLFTAVLMALIGVVLLYIFNQYFEIGLFSAAGTFSVRETGIYAEWYISEPGWFALMMFTFFFIVGPVEELQYRGFLQDQINRVQKPWMGIIISALFFGAGHLPIYFILYHLTPEVALITMMYTFSFGILMSLFYHWSRNIIGPIVLHGFWDWQLSVYTIIFISDVNFIPDPIMISFLGWLSSAFAMAIIAIMLYLAYRLWWKRERPAGSLGFQVPGVAKLFKPTGFIARTGYKLRYGLISRRARYYDTHESPLNQTLLFTGIIIIFFCLGVMGVSAAAGMEFTMNLQRQREQYEAELSSGEDASQELQLITDSGSIQGRTSEQQESYQRINLNYEKLVEINCLLSWQDEPSQFFRGTNELDEFKISIIAPNDEIMAESELSTAGAITVAATLPNYEEENFEENYVGDWTFHIEAGNCGDDHGPLGFRTATDDGNDWTLEYEYIYLEDIPELP